LEGNIAYANGELSDGYNADSNQGVGFKLGGEGLPVDHVVTGNLAFDNNLDGFSDNFNPGRMTVTNNTAVDNKRFNFIFRINPNFAPADQGVFRNNLSIRTQPGRADTVSGDVDSTNYLYDGTATTGEGGTVGSGDLLSLTAPEGYGRNDEGGIAWGDFARPARRSWLTCAGTDGTYVGAIPPPGSQGRGAANGRACA
jgi:hypothetical protein